jgi:hypothetical protein
VVRLRGVMQFGKPAPSVEKPPADQPIEVDPQLGVVSPAHEAGPAALSILTALLKEPYGCRFCDSGKLRSEKPHDDACPYLAAEQLLEAVLEPPADQGERETVAWLIERGQASNHLPTIWWKGGDTRPFNDWPDCWTDNAWHARRFRTKEAAVTIADRLFPRRPTDKFPSATVVEHAFIAEPPAGEGEARITLERAVSDAAWERERRIEWQARVEALERELREPWREVNALKATLERERAAHQELREALRGCLASALPNSYDHPDMTKAWEIGRAALQQADKVTG